MDQELGWLIAGIIGQGMFFLAFLLQWLHSERKRRSEIPLQFWYFSLAGGVVLLAYAIYKRDPVFIVAQLTGVIVYARNLHLLTRTRQG